jgi:hypothetical protein
VVDSTGLEALGRYRIAAQNSDPGLVKQGAPRRDSLTLKSIQAATHCGTHLSNAAIFFNNLFSLAWPAIAHKKFRMQWSFINIQMEKQADHRVHQPEYLSQETHSRASLR